MWTYALWDHQSRWSTLRGLGNLPIAKATMAVPVIGYFLLFNEEIVNFLSLHTDFCEPARCGPSLRLVLLYIGCCWIALGAALYSMSCPKLIKKYDSAAAFFEAESTYFSQPRNLDYLLQLIKQKTEAQPLAHNAPEFNYSGQRHNVERNSLADPMGELYRLLNISRPWIRLASLISYYVGISLLIVPTVMTVFQVLSAFDWGRFAVEVF